jgi:enterochelin esterase family protein
MHWQHLFRLTFLENTKVPPMTRFFIPVVSLFLCTPLLWAADDYQLGPDSQEQPDVPRGKVSKHSWTSKIFPETVRDYWIYVPAQYDPKQPACVMVFQDGGSYVNVKGQFRVPIVFDNRTA